MEINTEQPLKALKEQLQEYIELKTELARLSLIEHVAKVASIIFVAIVGMLIISLFFLSLFITLSFFIGQLLHSYALGFLISSGVSLLILWYFIAIGSKQLRNFMIKKIIEETETTNND